MLSADHLLEAAVRHTGLDDYGDRGFTTGLGVLVQSINDEAGLTPSYEEAIRDEIVRVLVNRLRMQRDLTSHPEILDEEILPPVFITSLPRTGSTKLHRLLAATGDFNGLPFWMSYNFGPFPDSEGAVRDPRIAAAEEHLQWMYEQAPLYQQMHPQYAEEFEEELSLLDAGFNSLYRWAAFLDVPTYIEWVLSSDGMQAFRDLRVLLQYIQWQHYRGLNRRWVLKTPSLFGFESAYAATFAGTDFIVTHRDPVQIWPSVCTLFRGVRGMYYDRDFTDVAGEVVLHNFGEALKGHLAWRESYPPEKVLDVRFEEVISDEAALLRRIYAWLDMPFTEASESNLEAWLEMDARRGHVRSTATPEDYGLTEQIIRDRLAGYIDRYGEFLESKLIRGA
jgi:Sulfotransferase family